MMNQNAEYSAVNDTVRGQFFRRVWEMTTPYWRSEEKGKAWLLLFAVVALTLFSVAISVWINSWYKDFYNALQKKDEAAFWQLILYFCGIAAVAILAAVYRLYLTQMLTIRWRAWLTEKHFARWLGHKNYYQLEQGGYTDNPDQRISEDLNSFTSNTLGLPWACCVPWSAWCRSRSSCGACRAVSKSSATPFPATCSGAPWCTPPSAAG
ncbi:hypothetical protein TRE132_09160 [Pseudomonas chlororaphis subsp. aurantiaca]|nr:hypothetical protein TRE132_09160 [Pseudomonas chlororaphis subsp. aurantiaca]